MALFEFFSSVSSLLYLVFLILAIKETIGLISTLGGGSKGGSTSDNIGAAWDKAKKWNDERNAKNQQKEIERQNNIKKEKQDSESMGRFIGNLTLKSTDALNVVAEGTQKLQEIVQNTERDYATVSKEITEKIALPMKKKAEEFYKAEHDLYPALRTDHNLLKDFARKINGVILAATTEINGNKTSIDTLNAKLSMASTQLPTVLKEKKDKEDLLKTKKAELEKEVKITPVTPSIKGKITKLNKAIEKLNLEIADLNKKKEAYEHVMKEAAPIIEVYTNANTIIEQKVNALTELLNVYKDVKLPDLDNFVSIERTMTGFSTNIKKETHELHDNFEKLSKLDLKKMESAKDVGIHKQRIEHSVSYLFKEINDIREVFNNRAILIKAIQDGKTYEAKVYTIEENTRVALVRAKYYAPTASETKTS